MLQYDTEYIQYDSNDYPDLLPTIIICLTFMSKRI